MSMRRVGRLSPSRLFVGDSSKRCDASCAPCFTVLHEGTVYARFSLSGQGAPTRCGSECGEKTGA